MPALMKIDQAGLSAGVAGKARTDGLATGALVTLTNTGTGSTRFQLLWVPPGDTTAVSSLAPTAPNSKVWTFTPTVNKPGTYRIELIQNEGLTSEVRERRVLRVRTPNRNLTIPALNELGDPAASLVNAGSGPIDAAEDNSNDYPTASLNGIRYAAWWRTLHELVSALDGLALGSNSIANQSAVAGSSVSDALNTLAGAVPVNARYGFVNAASTKLGLSIWGATLQAATTWNVAGDIPAGRLFRVALHGGGGGGSAGCLRSSRGGNGGGGGNHRSWLVSRAELIANLPLAMSLPLGGAGGVGATNNTGVAVNGAVGANVAVATWGPWTSGGGGGGGQQGTGATDSVSGGGGGLRTSGSGAGTGGGGTAPGGLPEPGTATAGVAVLVTSSTEQGSANGINGGASIFGGAAGATSPGNAVAASGGGRSVYGGGSGGAPAGTAGATGDGGLSVFGGGGGGSGGWQNGSIVTTSGAGGASGARTGGAGVAGVTSTSPSTITAGNGNAGQDALDPFTSCGAGGSGGGAASGQNTANVIAIAGRGGNGGFPGGGGGGGGPASTAAATSCTSGDGGKGGDSVLFLEVVV